MELDVLQYSVAQLWKAGKVNHSKRKCKISLDLILLSLVHYLEMNGKGFEMCESSSSNEIHDFWQVLLLIESLLTREKRNKRCLSKKSF